MRNHPLSKEYALEYQKMILANTPELLKEKKFTDPSRINSYRAAGAKKFEAFCDIMSGGRKRSQKQQKFFYCEICDRKMLYGIFHLQAVRDLCFFKSFFFIRDLKNDIRMILVSKGTLFLALRDGAHRLFAK